MKRLALQKLTHILERKSINFIMANQHKSRYFDSVIMQASRIPDRFIKIKAKTMRMLRQWRLLTEWTPLGPA